MSQPDAPAQTIPVLVSVFHHSSFVDTVEIDLPAEVGRRRNTDPPLRGLLKLPESHRLIIADVSEATVSRQHVRLEPVSKDRIRVVNLTQNGTTVAEGVGELRGNSHQELSLPANLTLGVKRLRIEAAPEFSPVDDPTISTLSAQTPVPGDIGDPSTLLPELQTLGQRGHQSLDEVVTWLRKIMGVFQKAVQSADFLQEAAQAVLDTVGLNSATVLRWDGESWHQEVARGMAQSANWSPSRTILERMRLNKRTILFHPLDNPGQQNSLSGVRAVVASPIMDGNARVIGALYCDRRFTAVSIGQKQENARITEMEGVLVELLACGAAAGLERQRHEREKLKFEQFFPTSLARKLQSSDDLLKGRNAEVSLLFCDIRGFTRISERLGPSATTEWINDVLSTFSDCVLEHDGVLVDYIGDELMAMWGAPDTQPDHAMRACRAAMAMIRKLPLLNKRWEARLEEPFLVGIGINTGAAHVGNVGTQRKFKYGPLGGTVNLASRVEGATKYVKTRLLITEHTARHLDDEFPVRRVAKVCVHNIADPVSLYELQADPPENWHELKEQFELALDHFEKNELRIAARILGKLMTDNGDDGPTIQLLSRVMDQIVNESAGFNPIWNLPGK